MWAHRRVTYSLVLPPFLLALGLAGCRSNDLIESELRAREVQLRETREELHRLEFLNTALQREVCSLREDAPKLPPEHAAQIYQVRRIVLGRLTGGYDADGKPGDEALQVVIEPRDGADQRIKAPGSARVEVLEISPEGLKTPLSSWDIPADQLRRHWREGLVGTGYFVLLPWKTWPSSDQLRVVVRFTLPDGRTFEADRDVKVRLGSEVPRPGMPPADVPGPLLPGTEPSLPTPRKVPPPPEPVPKRPPDPAPVKPPPAPVPRGPIEPAASWQPAPLEDAVQLRRPLPLHQP